MNLTHLIGLRNTRRAFLQHASVGIGTAALASMLGVGRAQAGDAKPLGGEGVPE